MPEEQSSAGASSFSKYLEDVAVWVKENRLKTVGMLSKAVTNFVLIQSFGPLHLLFPLGEETEAVRFSTHSLC